MGPDEFMRGPGRFAMTSQSIRWYSFNGHVVECKRRAGDAACNEPHPTRTDIALHSFECMDCGPVRTRAVSLRADKSPLELAVKGPSPGALYHATFRF